MAQSAHLEVKLDTLRGKAYASRNANDYCIHANDGSSLQMHGDRPLMDWQLTLRQTRRPLGPFVSPKRPPVLLGSRKRSRSVPEKDLHVDGVYGDCKYGNIADSGPMVRSFAANRIVEKDSVHWQVNLRSDAAGAQGGPRWRRYHQRSAVSFDRIKENAAREDPRNKLQETTPIDRAPDRRMGALPIRYIREDLPYDSVRYPGCEGTGLQNWRHLIHRGKTRTMLRHETTLRGYPDSRSDECISDFLGKKRWHFARTRDHVTEIDSKLKYLSTHSIQSEPRDTPLSRSNRLGGPILINGDEPLGQLKVEGNESEIGDCAGQAQDTTGVQKREVFLSVDTGGRREALYMHLEEPSLTNTSYYVHITYSTLILISVVTAVMITLPVPEQLSPEAYDALNIAENVFNGTFIMELALRLSTAPSLLPALTEPYNWLDLLIVAPYVALWCGVDRDDYKGLRLALFMVPAMRMAKITRNSSGWRLLVTSLSLSMDALRVPMLMLFFLVVWFASILYWLETDLNSADFKTFGSLPHAMWFSIVTISTVGYGDVELATTAGQVVASMLIIIGVSYMAMPLSIIGSTFWDVWTDRDRILIVDKIHQRLSRRQITREQVYNVFTQIDVDNSGGIDMGELEHMLNEEFRLAMPKRNVKNLFRHMDHNGSGKVCFEEFCQCLFPDLAATLVLQRSTTSPTARTPRGSAAAGVEDGRMLTPLGGGKRRTLPLRMGQMVLDTLWGQYEGGDGAEDDDDGSLRGGGPGQHVRNMRISRRGDRWQGQTGRGSASGGNPSDVDEKLREILDILRGRGVDARDLSRATKYSSECSSTQTDTWGSREVGTQTKTTAERERSAERAVVKTSSSSSRAGSRIAQPRKSFARGFREGRLAADPEEQVVAKRVSSVAGQSNRRYSRDERPSRERAAAHGGGRGHEEAQWSAATLADGVAYRSLTRLYDPAKEVAGSIPPSGTFRASSTSSHSRNTRAGILRVSCRRKGSVRLPVDAADACPIEEDSVEGREAARRVSRRLERLEGLSDPIKSSARHLVYAHLEEPSLHWITLNVYRIYNSLIIVSVVTSVLVTLPVPETLSYSTRDGLEVAETAFNVLFLLEILLRLVTSPHLGRALCEPYNWLDLMVVLPYVPLWVGVDRSDNEIVKLILYLVPAMRMLKLTRNSTGWRLLVISLSLSMDALRVPMLMLIFLVTWFASIIYWLEDVTLPDTAPAAAFASLPHAMWFSIVTISTVGYGDVAPATDGGRAISAMLIIVGASYMALPLNIIGSTFWDVWTDRDKLLIIDKIQQRLSRRRITRERLYEVFETMDEDGSGVIDLTEFEHMLNRHFRLGMPTHSILRLFRTIDADGEGRISFDEFCACLFPELVNPELSFPTRASIPRNSRASLGSGERASIMRVVSDGIDPLEAEIEASKAGGGRCLSADGHYLKGLEDAKAAEAAHHRAVLDRLCSLERELESNRRDMQRMAAVVDEIANKLTALTTGNDGQGHGTNARGRMAEDVSAHRGTSHTDGLIDSDSIVLRQRLVAVLIMFPQPSPVLPAAATWANLPQYNGPPQQHGRRAAEDFAAPSSVAAEPGTPNTRRESRFMDQGPTKVPKPAARGMSIYVPRSYATPLGQRGSLTQFTVAPLFTMQQFPSQSEGTEAFQEIQSVPATPLQRASFCRPCSGSSATLMPFSTPRLEASPVGSEPAVDAGTYNYTQRLQKAEEAPRLSISSLPLQGMNSLTDIIRSARGGGGGGGPSLARPPPSASSKGAAAVMPSAGGGGGAMPPPVVVHRVRRLSAEQLGAAGGDPRAAVAAMKAKEAAVRLAVEPREGQAESVGIGSDVSEAGDTSAPMIMESPQLSDSTPTSHTHDDTREVSKLMEENAELRRQLSRLEEEVEELRAELDVKNRLLANADISRSDGERTARNTPNSAGLANNSSYESIGDIQNHLSMGE
ncbi:hypothetical protein FOL46_001713 [Perkinsus olseni]|uniref:EF-hand domain-containing protein n=1 Tax=Perkinsus olseni TaxID=32597 RepID=A0A7J6MUY4_PEROL|nr:hypothetical protein FOL46_001713 [Perkinsus olseni]